MYIMGKTYAMRNRNDNPKFALQLVLIVYASTCNDGLRKNNITLGKLTLLCGFGVFAESRKLPKYF